MEEVCIVYPEDQTCRVYNNYSNISRRCTIAEQLSSLAPTDSEHPRRCPGALKRVFPISQDAVTS
jgi:hypothetical protein